MKEIQPKFIKYAREHAGKLIYKHEMISEGDKILIGMSGGKDSFALVDILANRKKYLPWKFDLIAVHIYIDNIGYEVDAEKMESFCKQHGIPFILKKFSIDDPEKSGKGPCFLCSWFRRKALFELTREFNCNKLALGHHMDDALETTLMNMVFHGSLSSLPYKLSMFDGRVHVIRPLLEFTDQQMREYGDTMNFPKEIKRCPHESETGRDEMRGILKNFESIYPEARKNMFRALSNQFQEYLPDYRK